MSKQGFKWHFIRTINALVASVSLFLAASYGQAENGGPPSSPASIQAGNSLPPVEQALVPEGVFAVQLAEALKPGPAQDEAKAEELLSGLGIEPKNGWITEYPVTPNVLGDIEKGVATASDQGKIALPKEQALKLFGDVKAKLGLQLNFSPSAPVGVTVKPGNTTIYIYTDQQGVTHYTDAFDSIPKEYRDNVKIIQKSSTPDSSIVVEDGMAQSPGPQYMPTPNPEAINDYYYDEGPPVVTYYSPPDPYYYLYSWVPYPFWYTSYYFPGFFVLNNFRRHVVFNQQAYFVTHHNGTLAYSRPLGGGPVAGGLPGNPVQHLGVSSAWFATSKAQTGARAIVALNRNSFGQTNRAVASQVGTGRQQFPAAGNSRNMGNAPVFQNGQAMAPSNYFRSVPHYGGGYVNRPIINQRAFLPNAPRMHSPPAQNRTFSPPASFMGGASGGYGGGISFGGGHGGGMPMGHGGAGSGGSRGGGHR